MMNRHVSVWIVILLVGLSVITSTAAVGAGAGATAHPVEAANDHIQQRGAELGDTNNGFGGIGAFARERAAALTAGSAGKPKNDEFRRGVVPPSPSSSSLSSSTSPPPPAVAVASDTDVPTSSTQKNKGGPRWSWWNVARVFRVLVAPFRWMTRSRLVSTFLYVLNAALLFLLGWILGWTACSKGADRRKESISDVVRQLADETHDENILRGPILKKVIGTLPKWIKYPDVDRVPWLNKAARQMWPHLDKAISTTVINALEPVLNSLVNKTKRTTTLKFSKFTLGLEPPVLASVKVFTESEGEVGLDIEFKWGAKEPGVVLDVTVMGVSLPVALEHIEAYGTFRIIFGPLVPWWPSFSALTLAFVGKPNIDFNLKLIGGDITAVPYVSRLLGDLIKNQLVELMVWPRRLFVPITEDQPDAASAMLANVSGGKENEKEIKQQQHQKNKKIYTTRTMYLHTHTRARARSVFFFFFLTRTRPL